MRFVLLLPVLVVLAVAIVTVTVAVGALLTRRADVGPDGSPATVREGRRPLLRAGGLVVGVVGAAVVWSADDLGRGVLLAAPVLVLGILLGLLAAELVVRPPTGPRRSASMTTRRTGDHLPRRLAAVVVSTGVTLAALGAVTTVLGSADDMGRAGRVLTAACSAQEQSSRGPWPGAYYTAPLAVVVALGVGLGLLVLRATVARPPLPQDPDQGPAAAGRTEAVDTGLRRRAARSVVAGLGLLLAVPLAGTAFVAGSAVVGLAGCAPGWWAVVGVGLLLLAVASGVVVLWCAAVVLLDRWTPVGPPAPAARP